MRVGGQDLLADRLEDRLAGRVAGAGDAGRAGAPVPDLRHRAQSAGGGRLSASTRAMPGSSRCASASPGRATGWRRACEAAGFAVLPQRLDLFPVRRPRGVGHRRLTTRPSPQQAVERGRGRGGAAVGLRRAGPAAPHDPAVLRQDATRRSTPASPRMAKARELLSMTPAEEAAPLLAELGVDGGGRAGKPLADRRPARSAAVADRRAPPTSTRPASVRMRPSSSGARSRRRAAANWSG